MENLATESWPSEAIDNWAKVDEPSLCLTYARIVVNIFWHFFWHFFGTSFRWIVPLNFNYFGGVLLGGVSCPGHTGKHTRSEESCLCKEELYWKQVWIRVSPGFSISKITA